MAYIGCLRFVASAATMRARATVCIESGDGTAGQVMSVLRDESASDPHEHGGGYDR